INDLLALVPQRAVLGPTALEDDVVVFHETGQLAYGALSFVAFAIFDDVGVGGETAHFAKVTLDDAVDLDEEVELTVGVVAVSVRHGTSLRDGSDQASLTSEPSVHWPMRKITNSVGFTGAMPINIINLPLSMSACVMVVRSQRTKNASAAERSCSMPSI